MKKLNRQQLTVFIGALIYEVSAGIFSNTEGTLFTAMRLSLGFPLTRVSTYFSVKGLSGALFAALFARYFFKVDKRLFAFVCVFFNIAGHMLFLLGTGAPMWALAAIVYSLGNSTFALAVPFVLNQWMPDFAGTATGIAMAMLGFAGTVFNPIIAKATAAFGWQGALWVMSISTAVLAIPGILMMLGRPVPETEPAPAGKDLAQQKQEPFNTRLFLLVLLAILAPCSTWMFSSYMTNYVTDMGFPLASATLVSSTSQIGNMLWKIVFGWCIDKIGPWKTCMGAYVMISLSFIGFVFFGKTLGALFLSAAFYSLVFSQSAVGVARIAIRVFGANGYKKYGGYLTAATNIITATLSSFIGPLYEATGNYNFLFVMFLCLEAVSIPVMAVFARKEKKAAQKGSPA
ncbi:MAG: MFS transporter [Firmicutes bacterium]|nr:MFS transporter [Bacillota bacterium]